MVVTTLDDGAAAAARLDWHTLLSLCPCYRYQPRRMHKTTCPKWNAKSKIKRKAKFGCCVGSIGVESQYPVYVNQVSARRTLHIYYRLTWMYGCIYIHITLYVRHNSWMVCTMPPAGASARVMVMANARATAVSLRATTQQHEQPHRFIRECIMGWDFCVVCTVVIAFGPAFLCMCCVMSYASCVIELYAFESEFCYTKA